MSEIHIDLREFVALDPEQERIKNELQLEGIIYTYKTGESIPDGQKGLVLPVVLWWSIQTAVL